MRKHSFKGFSLTEILIAMGIVALIAIFTVPKVLNTTKNSDVENWRRSVKQAASEVESAYSQYRLNNRTVATSTTLADITPYLNYISRDSVSQFDGTPCDGTLSCSSGSLDCYRLKNGSLIQLYNNRNFAGTSITNGLNFKVDPDGKVTGGTGDDGKAVNIYMYYNGRMKTRGQIDNNTTNSSGSVNANASCDPNWFNWN